MKTKFKTGELQEKRIPEIGELTARAKNGESLAINSQGNLQPEGVLESNETYEDTWDHTCSLDERRVRCAGRAYVALNFNREETV